MKFFLVLLKKEVTDAVREKRFAVFTLGFTLALGLLGYGLANPPDDLPKGILPLIPKALDLTVALFFFHLTAVLLLAGFFVLDSVGKERDAGMLGLLLTSRARPSTLLATKTVLAAMLFLVVAALGLLLAFLLSLSFGSVVVQAVLRFYLGPLLWTFVFLLGSGLLFSVALSGARMALAAGLGLYVPLFLVGATPLFDPLLAFSPSLRAFFEWTPFAVASDGMDAIVWGAPLPLAKVLLVLGIGLACHVAAFLVFRRQEVP